MNKGENKMKITRNGIEIELTNVEARTIYELKDREYLLEDIASKAEDMGVELSEKELETIAGIAKQSLENNDSYWENYWATIKNAIKKRNEEMIV